MSIEDEVESSALERETEAVGADHFDLQPG